MNYLFIIITHSCHLSHTQATEAFHSSIDFGMKLHRICASHWRSRIFAPYTEKKILWKNVQKKIVEKPCAIPIP